MLAFNSGGLVRRLEGELDSFLYVWVLTLASIPKRKNSALLRAAERERPFCAAICAEFISNSGGEGEITGKRSFVCFFVHLYSCVISRLHMKLRRQLAFFVLVFAVLFVRKCSLGQSDVACFLKAVVNSILRGGRR